MSDLLCPHCQQVLDAAALSQGEGGTCPRCGGAISVNVSASPPMPEFGAAVPPLPPRVATVPPRVGAAPPKKKDDGGVKCLIIGLVLAGVSVMMIFVMGILAAIMLPALARAREAARQASCSNNLKQFGLVHKMFASDQRGGMFPELSSEPGRLMFTLEPTDGGATVYPEYLSDLSMFVCQSDLDASLIQEGVDAGDPNWVIDDDAYFYLGYVVENDAEMATFAEAYSAIVAEGENFLEDIPVEEGTGSFGLDRLLRLREGVERFGITDINNPGSAAMLQSKIPIMIERPDNHAPGGGNVLYMDGHVEFKRYPGEWPMTEESIGILEGLDALGY